MTKIETRGRPQLYTDEQSSEFAARVDEYFDDDSNLPFRITGLALWLGMTKETLYQYEKRPFFSDSVKRARLKIEDQHVRDVLTKQQIGGPIFVLKACFGYKESNDLTLNHGGQADNPVKIVFEMVDAKK